MAQPLTDAESARVRAHMDHLDNAMAVITKSEFDPDKVTAAHEAAARAHPVSKELFQAYSAKVLTETADPLRVLNDLFNILKPDAPWGLAVYRASYNDDAAWHRIHSVLRRDIESSLAVHQAQPGLLARHELVVMDDYILSLPKGEFAIVRGGKLKPRSRASRGDTPVFHERQSAHLRERCHRRRCRLQTARQLPAMVESKHSQNDHHRFLKHLLGSDTRGEHGLRSTEFHGLSTGTAMIAPENHRYVVISFMTSQLPRRQIQRHSSPRMASKSCLCCVPCIALGACASAL